MSRAFFLALGLNTLLLGAQCFVLDRFEFSTSFSSAIARDPAGSNTAPDASRPSVFQNSAFQYRPSGDSSVGARGRMFKPREWMPWSLLAVGAIIVMYTGAAKPA
jgi:hypothetical protein